MTIRTIIEIPSPILKQISAPVENFDDDLKTLVADMFETMYDAPGIGLAAIQVGVPLRVLVIDLQPEDEDAEPEVDVGDDRGGPSRPLSGCVAGVVNHPYRAAKPVP